MHVCRLRCKVSVKQTLYQRLNLGDNVRGGGGGGGGVGRVGSLINRQNEVLNRRMLYKKRTSHVPKSFHGSVDEPSEEYKVRP